VLTVDLDPKLKLPAAGHVLEAGVGGISAIEIEGVSLKVRTALPNKQEEVWTPLSNVQWYRLL
jgi:hypothetical protein